MGYASAMAWVLFIITMICTLVFIKTRAGGCTTRVGCSEVTAAGSGEAKRFDAGGRPSPAGEIEPPGAHPQVRRHRFLHGVRRHTPV